MYYSAVIRNNKLVSILKKSISETSTDRNIIVSKDVFNKANTKGIEYFIYDEKTDEIIVNPNYIENHNTRIVETRKLEVRSLRNLMLLNTDQYMTLDYPMQESEKEKLKEYRQYLRDYTKQEQWYANIPLLFIDWKGEVV